MDGHHGLVTLVGLGISVGGPVVRLNGSITRLNTLLQAMEARLNALERDLEAQAGKAADSHRGCGPGWNSRTGSWANTRQD